MVVYYTSHLVVKRVIDQVQPSSVLPPSVACGFQFVWLRVGNLIIRNTFVRAYMELDTLPSFIIYSWYFCLIEKKRICYIQHLISSEGCAPPPLVGFVRTRQKLSTLHSNRIEVCTYTDYMEDECCACGRVICVYDYTSCTDLSIYWHIDLEVSIDAWMKHW